MRDDVEARRLDKNGFALGRLIVPPTSHWYGAYLYLTPPTKTLHFTSHALFSFCLSRTFYVLRLKLIFQKCSQSFPIMSARRRRALWSLLIKNNK